MNNNTINWNDSLEYSDIEGKEVNFYSNSKRSINVNENNNIDGIRNIDKTIKNNLISKVFIHKNFNKNMNTYINILNSIKLNSISIRNIIINENNNYTITRKVLKFNISSNISERKAVSNYNIKCNSSKFVIINIVNNTNIIRNNMLMINYMFNIIRHKKYDFTYNSKRNIMLNIITNSNLNRNCIKNYNIISNTNLRRIKSLTKIIKIRRFINKTIKVHNITYRMFVLKVNPVPITFAL